MIKFCVLAQLFEAISGHKNKADLVTQFLQQYYTKAKPLEMYELFRLLLP
jgi:hypothetical protein